MMLFNPILSADSYKTSHYNQYPPGTTGVYSYIEAREKAEFPEVMFFGLQAFLKQFLQVPIVEGDIEEADRILSEHGLPFNREGWELLIDRHGGHYPVEVRAIPEGTVVPTGNVLVTIHNTDPDFYWLPSYLETVLLQAVWYASTVATTSFYCKSAMRLHWHDTVDDDKMGGLHLALHDFGFRGGTSIQSAAIAGAAHLINFMGTDCLPSLSWIMDNYSTDKVPGISVPAAEHSTMTAWGMERETEAYANMIDQYGGDGKIFSVVSDSYDIHNAVDNIWGKELAEKVRTNGGRLVIRPDSGHPAEIVLYCLESLGNSFGYTTNSKGYKVLPDYVRILQGDGVDIDMIDHVLSRMKAAGWSAENVVFGMGGALHQQCDRDTMSFAMKTSAIWKNGVCYGVSKNPAIDPGKKSKAGILKMVLKDGKFQTVPNYAFPDHEDLLCPVYRDGEIIIDHTFEEILERSSIYL